MDHIEKNTERYMDQEEEFIFAELEEIEEEPMRGLQIQEKILYTLSLFNYLPVTVLLTLSKNPRVVYRKLSKAIEDEHIKMSTFTTRGSRSGSKYGMKCYCITTTGIKYLRRIKETRLTEETHWVQEIKYPNKTIKFNGESYAPERMVRYGNIAAASMICYLCGMNVTPLYTVQTILDFIDQEKPDEMEISDLDHLLSTQENHLHNYITPALKAGGYTQNENGRLMLKESSDMLFTNAYDVKAKLMAKFTARAEFQGGRMCGIVETPLKSAIFFLGDKRGMTWNEWVTKKDTVKLYLTYLKHFGKYENQKVGEVNAVMFVDNAYMFQDLYMDQKQKNPKGSYMGKGFSSFAIFPITRKGVEQFKDYMQIRTGAYEEAIAENAVNSGTYQYNGSGNTDLFPLETEQGVKVAIGFFIDVVKCRRIERNLEMNQHEYEYAILCYDWQEEFYRRIFPEIHLETLPG